MKKLLLLILICAAGAGVYYVSTQKNAMSFVTVALPSEGTGSQGVYVFQNGQVLEDGKIYADNDLGMEGADKLISGKPLTKGQDAKSYEKFDEKLAVMSIPGVTSQHEWLYQIMPRLHILQKSDQAFDKLYFYALTPEQLTILKSTGIKDDQIFQGQPNQVVTAKELIVTTLPPKPEQDKAPLPWLQEFVDSFNPDAP